MATKTTGAESVKQISYLAGALKAPRISDAATRLAEYPRHWGPVVVPLGASALGWR